ncbi:MAG: VOC family protein [Pseudomonadota bacterium]
MMADQMDRAAASQEDRGFKVRALGEIAIRCANLATMSDFYRNVIGLEPYARRPHGESEIHFFRIAEGFGGHTAVLALFPQDAPLLPHESVDRRGGALHHLALTVSWDEQANVCAWYDKLGQEYRVTDFAWTGWRGVFTRDPEGNTVELVAGAPHGPWQE